MENFVIDAIKKPNQKTFQSSKDIFISKICRTIQGEIVLVVVLVISNRRRASRSSAFEITRAISPWIVLQSVQLLLLIAEGTGFGISEFKGNKKNNN